MTDTSKDNIWKPLIAGWGAKVEPFGCSIAPSPHAYEIAKVTGPGVALIIYPHKTGTGHRHARVRNNGSKDIELSRRAIAALDLWCKQDCHLTVYGYRGPQNDDASQANGRNDDRAGR